MKINGGPAATELMEHSLILEKKVKLTRGVLIYELLDFVDDVVDSLGSRHAINLVQKILTTGPGQTGSLRYLSKQGKLTSVVDYIHDQFWCLNID